MSPSSGDASHTPEPKSTGGFASVFKSLTGGGRSSRSPNVQTTAPPTQHVSGASNGQSPVYGGPPDYDHLHEQLKIGNPLPERIAAAESICHAVRDYPLSGITTIFREAKDLIEPTKPIESRIAGFQLLTACVQYAASTDPERLAYYNVLTASNANPEDFNLQLVALVELAKHGKELAGFHYAVIPLLTSWLQWCFKTTAAARKKAGHAAKSKGKIQIPEEHDLSLLFAFITDVIKFSCYVITEQATGELIDVILGICLQTPLSGDIRACISIIDAIITFGEVPNGKLPDCMKVISSIHCLVEDAEPAAWNTIKNFSTSHNGQAVVQILLDILRNPVIDGDTGKQKVREVRGAISVLRKLFAKNGEERFPLVPFTQLVQALDIVTTVEHSKLDLDLLKLILSLFGNENQPAGQNVMEEDWSALFDVVVRCSQRALETPDGRQPFNRSRFTSPLSNEDPQEHGAAGIAHTLYKLIIRVEQLFNAQADEDFLQQEECVSFFTRVHAHLPESCSKMVIDHFIEYRYCYPSDIEWKENIKIILNAFFSDRAQPTSIRLHALRAVTEVFQVVEMMQDEAVADNDDPDVVRTLVAAILDDIGEEREINILQETIAFAVGVAENADHDLFDYVIRTIRGTILTDRLQSPLGSPGIPRQISNSSTLPPAMIQTPSNVVTKGLVLIWMRTMDKSTYKSVRTFEEVLKIASSVGCEVDARISAMKMLFRLRADWANRIHMVLSTDSDGLAASLYRTSASLARKQAADEEAQQQRASRAEESSSPRASRSVSFSQSQTTNSRPTHRTASGIARTIQRNHQTWMCPDPDALPEAITGKASSLLISIFENRDKNPSDSKDDTKEDERTPDESGTEAEDDHEPIKSEPLPTRKQQATLDIETYLDTITNLLRNGCDWEVYSFILVHLPSQLTNQALFKKAVGQIRSLREVVCDLIKNNSFLDPPISSGLRKADVAICLFQILNMVMGYHQHFSKLEQDDIVRTFLHGIGSTERTAKSCIHALSICSHEMPVSTAKALVTILQKMSTIITQSHVAVHILEFLACLARMPSLYVNFRDEEYRTVFTICFRYLQYVRDQPVKEQRDTVSRSSYPHARNSATTADTSQSESNFQPNTSDELPQYVYALAYHVIIFWFLSLKLNDRAGQVSWIAKNLVSVEANGREKIDEQAQVTLDFMQRSAYADVDESAADPTFTKERFGEILKKRWIVGHSIVTVEQATRGGWAQITKRQPSGTSCYVIREKFNRPPAHQEQVPQDHSREARPADANVVLPSHLLLQLAASIPQSGAMGRPIALPSEPFVDRAIVGFDRNFTVDGHKVGVIYIGENQTDEVEILSNIMGSSDYTNFLSGLGTLTKLQGANFNTQGLDRSSNIDGEYAFCWRDRVTEIVFHVTTQMPTDLERDPQCIGKKRHIGNDFVNIIFNNSGLPFRFDTFPSEFNYVNIVITPESRGSFVATRTRSEDSVRNAFYKVQVMSKPGFPEISPAAETKIMSLAALPGFIRLLALNASVFSLVWANKEGGEHVSSWRNRLREINRLRERYKFKLPSATHASPPGTSNGSIHESRNIRDSMNSIRRSSVANFLTNNLSEPSSQRSSILSTAETEVGPGGTESMVETLDFSAWA